MQDFRKLKIWERSHHLTLELYTVTASFPDGERYGLTSQIRRAAASVPVNIAEGAGRNTPADFARFLSIASGSASELHYHLILAHDLNLIHSDTFVKLEDELVQIRRMIGVFMTRLKTNQVRRTTALR